MAKSKTTNVGKKTSSNGNAAPSKMLVTFLLDRSGSMQACKGATIEGFNGYVATLQEEKETKILFTFLTFDTGSLDKIYVAEPIGKVAKLTEATYLPRGGTPLIDAAVKTIRATSAALNGGNDRVVVCIQTDGQENSSSEHTLEELRALIAEKAAAGWQFLFMGAGIDAYAQGAALGIPTANTMSYDHTQAATTDAAFTASARNTMSFGSGRAGSAAYSVSQRRAAGDRFWPARGDLKAPLASTPGSQRRKTVPDISF